MWLWRHQLASAVVAPPHGVVSLSIGQRRRRQQCSASDRQRVRWPMRGWRLAGGLTQVRPLSRLFRRRKQSMSKLSATPRGLLQQHGRLHRHHARQLCSDVRNSMMHAACGVGYGAWQAAQRHTTLDLLHSSPPREYSLLMISALQMCLRSIMTACVTRLNLRMGQPLINNIMMLLRGLLQ